MLAHPKRMAAVAAVYTVAPYVRTAEDVIAGLRHVRSATKKPRPQPEGKRVWASLTRDLKDVIAYAFDEADGRDLETGDYWDTARVATQEAGGWGGAYAVGAVGVKAGVACGPAAWICSPLFGLGGGALGYFSGSSLVSWLWDWW